MGFPTAGGLMGGPFDYVDRVLTDVLHESDYMRLMTASTSDSLYK